jgi:hypothetical protein
MNGYGNWARGSQLIGHQLLLFVAGLQIPAVIWLGCFMLVYAGKSVIGGGALSLGAMLLAASLLSLPLIMWFGAAARRRWREVLADIDASAIHQCEDGLD